ncbi:hypothetical protein Bpfe_001065, partial [Biomphalaria pfeifferi]
GDNNEQYELWHHIRSMTSYPQPQATSMTSYPQPQATSMTSYPQPQATSVTSYHQPQTIEKFIDIKSTCV